MYLATLPVLLAVSWVPAVSNVVAPTPAPQKTGQFTQTEDTITCPLTGEQISPCCCPAKK